MPTSAGQRHPRESDTSWNLWPILIYLPALSLGVFFLQPQANIRQTDAAQFQIAAQVVRDGNVAQLYRISREQKIYYLRPTFHAIAFLPVAYISRDAFLRAARIASYALLGLAVWLFPRWFPGIAHSRALLLCFQPFLWTVGLGQDTIILALFVGYGMHLIFHGKDCRGGRF